MCLIEDQSWIDCIDITSRWDTFVLYHLYGNKGVSLPLWPIRPRWFHTFCPAFCPCAEPLGDGYEGMWARFGSQGSIALNWHSRYSGTRYSGTWLYNLIVTWSFLPKYSQQHPPCKQMKSCTTLLSHYSFLSPHNRPKFTHQIEVCFSNTLTIDTPQFKPWRWAMGCLL